MLHKIALIAAVILPLWNIPLIVRIIQRGSSQDISLYWVFGVWGCLVLMFPEGITSSDIVWRTFNIVNLVLFSAVLLTVLLYRKQNKRKR